MIRIDIFKEMSRSRGQMSKSYHIIADYIVQNPHRIPFLTTAKLAEKTGVSEATIVRFATFLGYEGYTHLQKQLMQSVERQLNTVERLHVSQEGFTASEKAIFENFQADIQNITRTMEQLHIPSFEKAAEAIVNAKRIYIVSNRSALSLGTFFHYYLNILFGNCTLISTTEGAFDAIHHVNDEDVVIGISYARYTKSTLQAVSFAAERGATIVALTDYYHAPITAYADVALFAASEMNSFLDSFVAPLSIINTLIAFIGNKSPDIVEERLQQFEAIWDKYDVFY